MSPDDQARSRRKFLQVLVASPLLAGSDLAAMAAENPSLLQQMGAPTIKHLVPTMVPRA